MRIPAKYRMSPESRKKKPAAMSADCQTEELPAISKIPRSMLLTVTAAVPVCQNSAERTLGPGNPGTRRQIPAGTAHNRSGHAKRKVIKGEWTPWENML